jgi:hypothetical protein
MAARRRAPDITLWLRRRDWRDWRHLRDWRDWRDWRHGPKAIDSPARAQPFARPTRRPGLFIPKDAFSSARIFLFRLIVFN